MVSPVDVQGPRPTRPSTAGHGHDPGRRADAAPPESAGRARRPAGRDGRGTASRGAPAAHPGPPTWGSASVRAVLLLPGPFAVPRAGALELEQQGRLAPGESTELSPASPPRRPPPVPCAPALTWAPGDILMSSCPLAGSGLCRPSPATGFEHLHLGARMGGRGSQERRFRQSRGASLPPEAPLRPATP